MAVRGLFRKIFFPPNLVNCLRSQILLPSKTSLFLAVSKEKHYFKPIYWNFYRNICEVDVAIDPCQAKKQQGKNKSSGFLRSFYLASFTLGYLWYYSSTAHTANDDKDKENTAGHSLERCKGRFVFAVKNLTKGKDNASVNSSGAHPPGQPRGICLRCQSRGLGISIPQGDPRAFDTRVFERQISLSGRTRPLSKTGLSIRD